MKHSIAGHSHLENKVILFAKRAEKFTINCAESIEMLQKESKSRAIYNLMNYKQILSLAQECDQTITTFQSKVNLGDFLMHEPSNLYQSFGPESIIVDFVIT